MWVSIDIQYSRLSIIRHVRDFSDDELLEIPDYRVIFSVPKCTSVAPGDGFWHRSAITNNVNVIRESKIRIICYNNYMRLKLL